MPQNTTDFGFKEVPTEQKASLVEKVFSSVAPKYDLMNDLMSLGLHRFWKFFTVQVAQIKSGYRILDVAGGTGDLTKAFAKELQNSGELWLLDINAAMLNIGRDKLLDTGLSQVHFVQGNAEALPFPDNYFDVITIAFGLRNVTDKAAALRSMNRILKPGGQLLVLEFSKVKSPLLQKLYDTYSFELLPKIGQWVANDRASYQYLAESIRRHPDQATLQQMVLDAGFSRCDVHNFLAGVVALHRGHKA
jgi:demethylmenaquinone methyltransferase / 2-methoxy-6-polyprenyl-1,4-benzoquinol methylase